LSLTLHDSQPAEDIFGCFCILKRYNGLFLAFHGHHRADAGHFMLEGGFQLALDCQFGGIPLDDKLEFALTLASSLLFQ